MVRRLEDHLYDLSLADGGGTSSSPGAASTASDNGSGTPGGGAPPVPAVLIDAQALHAARERHEAADAAREATIKRCRDLQKLAKNAIFSLHRGGHDRAEVQLAQASDGMRALLEAADGDHAAATRQIGAVRGVV